MLRSPRVNISQVGRYTLHDK